MKTIALFDSHAHVSFEQFPEEERREVLNRAYAAGVVSIMNIATDMASLQAGWDLQAQDLPISLYCAAATTPHDVVGVDDPFFIPVSTAARERRISAIGETGFEFFHNKEHADHQETVFLRYALLAKETKLPLIIHCRDGFSQFLEILHDLGADVRGVLHCFTGTKENAKALLDLGWYISLSGIITFAKSESLREVARFLPEDRLLVETDSPYLAPTPHRGRRNEPAFLHYTVETIAALKNTTFEQIAHASFANAQALFGTS